MGSRYIRDPLAPMPVEGFLCDLKSRRKNSSASRMGYCFGHFSFDRNLIYIKKIVLSILVIFN